MIPLYLKKKEKQEKQKNKYFFLIEKNKEILKNIENKSCGFIRHFDITDHFPKSNKYKVEEEDLDFIKNTFKVNFSENTIEQNVLENNNEINLKKNSDEGVGENLQILKEFEKKEKNSHLEKKELNIKNFDENLKNGENLKRMEFGDKLTEEISKNTESSENSKKELINENIEKLKNNKKNSEELDLKNEEKFKKNEEENNKKFKLNQIEISKMKSTLIFEEVIEYLEKKEDKEFKKNEKLRKSLDPLVLKKISTFWQKKCKKLKRPLLRKNWKDILTKEKYGKVERMKKAFHKRLENINARKNKRIKKDNLIEIQKNLLNENKMSLIITKLVSYREKLKYIKILSFDEKCEKKIKEFRNNIFIIKEKVKKLENSFKKLMTPKMQKKEFIPPLGIIKNFTDNKNENSKKELNKKILNDNLKNKINGKNYLKNKKKEEFTEIEKKINLSENNLDHIKKLKKNNINDGIFLKKNDFHIFMANTIKHLNDYGFNLNEFYSGNIKNINLKIKKFILGNFQKNKIIKKVSLKKKIKNPISTEDYFLIKRKSKIDSTLFFLEKIKNEDIKKKKLYNFENFINENSIKRKFIDYQENFSHCRLFSNNLINPFVYNGKTNLTVNDEIVEKIKIKRYSKFFDFCEEENKIEFLNQGNRQEKEIEKTLKDMDFKNGFKNFKKKIKN